LASEPLADDSVVALTDDVALDLLVPAVTGGVVPDVEALDAAVSLLAANACSCVHAQWSIVHTRIACTHGYERVITTTSIARQQHEQCRAHLHQHMTQANIRTTPSTTALT
jgi:hypothetical protein